MEKLKIKFELFQDALATFEEAFSIFEQAKELGIEKFELTAQDSAVKRFEYTYDSFWKLLKNYLEHKHNLENINSPRAVFRACVEQRLCSDTQGRLLIDMIGDRNETTHNYDAIQVREIFYRLKPYAQLMSDICDKLEVL